MTRTPGPGDGAPGFEDLRRDLVRSREKWRNRGNLANETPPPGVVFEPLGPGQESVWSYSRPPRVEEVRLRARVVLAGVTIADSTRTLRVIETAGAPVIYFPPDDILPDVLRDTGRWTICEWKGVATTIDVIVAGTVAHGGAWSYRAPFTDLGMGYDRIRNYVGFLPARMEACYLGDERVRPQPGGFYGGWVTDALAGPIKGGPGSQNW